MKGGPLEAGLPSAVRIFNALCEEGECPLTVRDGRNFIENYADKASACSIGKHTLKGEKAIEVKNLWFRYEKNLPDVITDLDFGVTEGEIVSILGGNGSGKTTMLNLLAGLDKP
ncbi:MAG: ABC transporter ATP-binding protein/permease, partial [Oscillospiraceae bacterium]|nr:ABC transporter ATP-binding protein/permease [Oscillospiraceae bacterium]